MKLSPQRLLELYRQMLTIRCFEQKVVDCHKKGLVQGAAHSYTGMEAVAVGICAAMRDDDYVTSTHRGHGHCIARGLDVRRMLAEIFGRATGYCKGKGGSMHLADMDRGMLGADGIVGGGIPIAAGAALGCRVLGHDRVVVCFFGDGATNQGSFHEAANFAAVNKFAVVFVCENNHWALSAGFEATTAVNHVADRAAAYSMPGHIVDGNDVEEVHAVAVTAIERARTGEGPSLVECKTYRWEGHSVFPRPDPRPAQEIEDWRKRDPIAALLQVLLDNGILDADGQSQIEEEVAALIDEAESFARSSPLPDPETAFEDIYV
ncbi:MAG: thiamine pyrophosphate-dependent dehydrogenase E1 component subunit alpha [Planctomycetota bacterium]|nr:thiamine pyrophosphate-dependent dehydrogenase E1 component subunit alpha [Planctomycetota bacterium]